jgi:flagellar basal-body rod protein FlgC
MNLIVINETTKNFLNSIIACKNYHVKITDKGGYWIIENITEEILMDILVIIKLNRDIIADNIANANTTRTADGGPFIRQYLRITPENGMEIVKDTFHFTRFAWDPSHPDAIKTGPKEGFVEYPNVDIVSENADFATYGTLYNAIVEYLKVKYNVYTL